MFLPQLLYLGLEIDYSCEISFGLYIVDVIKVNDRYEGLRLIVHFSILILMSRIDALFSDSITQINLMNK